MKRSEHVLRTVAWLLVCGWAVVGQAATEDWPQWRGPNRDGHVPGFQLPQRWPKNLTRRWNIEVGVGHASPVVASGTVYVFAREGEEEVVRAMRLEEGKVLWTQKYPAPFTMSPYATSHGKGPKSTPTLAKGKLYTLGIGNILTCWDAQSGGRLWQHDFSKKYTKISPLWYGAASSPLVEGDLVIAQVGGCDEGAVVAVDCASGKIRWQWPDDGSAYASPVAMTIAGTRHVLTQSQNHSIDLAADSGALLWKLPFRTQYDQNIITPVRGGELVIFGGLRHPTTAYRLEKTNGQWQPQVVWENKDCQLYMSTPVVAGDRLIALANVNKGQFFCLDLRTGKTLWTSPGRMGEYAVLLVVGELVLAQNTRGELTFFSPRAESFQPIATYQVSNGPTWAQPAVVGRNILVKDENSLIRWTLDEGD